MLRFISICLFIELWEAISQTYKKNLDGSENSYQSKEIIRNNRISSNHDGCHQIIFYPKNPAS